MSAGPRPVAIGHAARHEAPDKGFALKPHRPHHCSAGAVRPGDHSVVGNVDPSALETDAVMAILRFPIDIADSRAVRERTAYAPAGCEPVEPFVEFGMA